MNLISTNNKIFLKIVISFLLALVITIIPLPGWLYWFHPMWLVLVLIYWVLKLPEYFGFFAAFVTGVFLDILYNTTIGEHAFGLIVITYFLLKFNNRINFFSFLQKTTVIFILLLVYQFLVLLCEFLMGKQVIIWEYLLSTLINAIVWPYLDLAIF